MKLKTGFSTCPNDTFMFDAMVNGKIDTKGMDFEVQLADIEALNNLAYDGELDITKISYAAYSRVSDKYIFLNSGSALGKNNGPILISKRKVYPDEVNHLKIAIPGELTTANLLLSIAYPNAKDKKPYLFSDIEDAVLSNEVDAGLIIHENRFTYQKRGLKKIVDLGAYWEKETGKPIPLGGIAIKREIANEIQIRVDHALHESVKFAFENKDVVMPYVRKYAQEMKDEVMLKHIDLYVNNFSVSIGQTGREAVEILFKKAQELNLTDSIIYPIFIKNLK